MYFNVYFNVYFLIHRLFSLPLSHSAETDDMLMMMMMILLLLLHFTIPDEILSQTEKQRYDGWFNNVGHPQWGSIGEQLCEQMRLMVYRVLFISFFAARFAILLFVSHSIRLITIIFMMNSFAMLGILYLIGNYYIQGHRHIHSHTVSVSVSVIVTSRFKIGLYIRCVI